MESIVSSTPSATKQTAKGETRPHLRHLRLHIRGISVHGLAAGTCGPHIVILHGGGLDAAGVSFKNTIPVLAKRYRVFALDWPGFGESDAMPRTWRVEECVEFVAGVLDGLRLKRATLVGLSMGEAFALGFTLRSPLRVKRLVLVDSAGLGGDIPGGRLSYFALHLPFLDELRWALLSRSRTLAWRTVCAPLVNRAEVVDALDQVVRLARRPGAGAAFRQLQRSEYRWLGLRTNYLNRLGEINVPTLIVHGAEDSLIPVDCARRAHALIRYSKLEIIPACGHLPPVERPDSFKRILCSFLESKRQPVLDRIQKAFFRTRLPDQRPALCDGLRKRKMRFCGSDNVSNRKRAN
jgi:pimeloyl-ACP methyl ester carboxylesterase